MISIGAITNAYPVCLQFSKIVSCCSAGFGDWADDYMVEVMGDLKDALAIFVITARGQDCGFGVNETGADD